VELSAAATISASPERVFAYLRRLDRHWALTGPRAVPLRAQDDGDGYVLRLRGPVGIRRTVRTRIVSLREPALLVGRVEAGRRTRATLSWSITSCPGGSRVVLAARTDSLGLADRLLLLGGGRWWLGHTLRGALGRLQARLALEVVGEAAAEAGPVGA
jgi:hypothetical protein